MESTNNTRFLINPSKIPPYDTLSVGDWVVFDVFEEDCEIGKITGFEKEDNSSEILATLTLPNGIIAKRNVFRELGHTVYKIDNHLAIYIKSIKED